MKAFCWIEYIDDKNLPRKKYAKISKITHRPMTIVMIVTPNLYYLVSVFSHISAAQL